MNHGETHSTQTNRPASRRRHRRLAIPVPLPGALPAPAKRLDSPLLPRAATTLVSLPQRLVREAGMLELLAAEARIAELEGALAEARAAAFVDPLTGALNRRGFDKASERELARARRSGAHVTLAHIDLDDFKALNDTHGHQAGDKALVFLVDLLHKSIRPTDVLCRFGGEEFVLMLPDTRLDDGMAAVARFQAEFSAQAIPGTARVMTFSAGVVAHCLEDTIDQSIQRADEATYVAKRAGKNRVATR